MSTATAWLCEEAPVGRGRIEMFQYRQALVRLRTGDSGRDVARSGLMGRDKLPTLPRRGTPGGLRSIVAL